VLSARARHIDCLSRRSARDGACIRNEAPPGETMATSNRSNSRATANARTEILDQLKEDHKRVKKAYKEFQKMDPEESPEECEALVQQVLHELQVHTALEEELLYPAARDAIEEDLVDEAEVEHESAHALMDQLMGMSATDEKFAARFTVLCEYVLHHVKEEEGEMFPQLEKAKGIDWESLSEEMTSRRTEMLGTDELEEDEQAETMEEGEGEEMALGGRSSGSKAGRDRRARSASAEDLPDNGVVPSGGATSRKL
jgi:hemerythrin superfamily protein